MPALTMANATEAAGQTQLPHPPSYLIPFHLASLVLCPVGITIRDSRDQLSYFIRRTADMCRLCEYTFSVVLRRWASVSKTDISGAMCIYTNEIITEKKQSGQKRRICGHLRTILVYTHRHTHTHRKSHIAERVVRFARPFYEL